MNKSDFFTADALKPHFTYADYCESADAIASHLGSFRPEVLLVLGSGLGFLGERAKVEELDMVGDEHQIARGILGVHRARGVRHDHRLCAE